MVKATLNCWVEGGEPLQWQGLDFTALPRIGEEVCIKGSRFTTVQITQIQHYPETGEVLLYGDLVPPRG